MNSRTTGLLIPVLLLLFSCGPSAEEKAAFRLKQARHLLSQQDTALALALLDSIPLLFPRAAFSVNAAKNLKREVYWDLMQKKEKEMDHVESRIDSLIRNFVAEKTEYDRHTRYIHRSQLPENRMSQSYLSAGVDETGALILASHYYGGGSIHHTGVRVIAGDSAVSTAPVPPGSSDSYRGHFMGFAWERIRYRDTTAAAVAAFIAGSRAKQLQVIFSGGRDYGLRLSDADRRAIAETAALAEAFKGRDSLRQLLLRFRNPL